MKELKMKRIKMIKWIKQLFCNHVIYIEIYNNDEYFGSKSCQNCNRYLNIDFNIKKVDLERHKIQKIYNQNGMVKKKLYFKK
jgi:hypothetical protein